MDGNLRRGALAEELGLLLLSSFTAIAPVPRPHDVGIDVVATLLRPQSERHLIPEKSFYVQFKARSVRVVEYNEERVDWFRQLELPMFLGSADIATGTLQIHSLHEAAKALHESPSRCFEIHLDPVESILSEDLRTRRVYLGEPALELAVADIADRTKMEAAYCLMRAWCQVSSYDLAHRHLRRSSNVRWRTGEPPEVIGSNMTGSGAPADERTRLLGAMTPHVQAMLLDLTGAPDPSVADRVYALIDAMTALGVDPDPGSTLRDIVAWRSKS